MEKTQFKIYKFPTVALLWSVLMPGFGQFYNGQYIFGFVITIGEFTTNILSNLNLAIHYSFHGHFLSAHDVVSYQWGMYYPSLFSFSIWQAYNKAIQINFQRNGKDPPTKVYLTGFCAGLVIGMNLGIYWHHHFLDNIHLLECLKSPIFNGLLFGGIGGIIGLLIEKYIKSRFNHFKRKSLIN